MKILRLDLKAFGPFTDEVLDLSADQYGLHLVYGPNEAGKSSALRALNQLLYGILPRTSDDFIHPYANLRVGGVLTNGDGGRLEILRRKANKNDLRGPDDNRIIEPSMLARYLGRLDRDTFESMFGIDHAALVRGGREIVEGRGSLGQVLFSAGSGIADLKGVQEQLEKDAGELFSPRAKNPRINARLAAWEVARKTVTAAQLPSSEWEGHDRALRQAQDGLSEINGKLGQALAEHARLERIRQAVPLVVRLNATIAEFSRLGPVQILPERFGERRRDAATRLASAETGARSAAEAIAEIDVQMTQLVGETSGRSIDSNYSASGSNKTQRTFDSFFDALLERADAVEELAKNLGSYRKAQRDLRETVAPRREQAEWEARRLLKQLRPELGLADVETLRIKRQQRIEIQNLGNRYEALSTQQNQTRSLVAALEESLSAAQERLSQLPPARNADLLKSVLRRAAAVSRIEEERAVAAADLSVLEAQAATALARLPLWTGTLEALSSVALPSSETIDTFESRLAEAERNLTLLKEQSTKLENTRLQLERQLEQAARGGEPPSDAALAESRRHRDEGWQLVRAAWLDGHLDVDGTREFTGSDATLDVLADAFEQTLKNADAIADELRRDADRVAARATLFAQRQECLDDLAKVAASREAAAGVCGTLLNEWQALWQASNIEPLTPREMRGWDRKLQALLHQSEAIRKQRAAVDTCDARADRCRQELNRSLEALGEPVTQPGESLAAQLERSHFLVDQIDAAAAARTRLEDEAATLARRLATERAKAVAAEGELASWQARWSAAVAPLGLSTGALPEQANEVLAQIDSLFDHLSEAEGYRERTEGIVREAEQFACETRSLLGALGKDGLLARLAVDQAADVLLAEFRQATEDRGRLETLGKQRAKQAAQLAQSKKDAAQARSLLDSLCQEADCDDPARLPELEERSAQAKELKLCERNLHEQLSLLSGGSALEEFVEEVGRVDADNLANQLDELGRRLAELSAERDALLNTATLETKALADMDTSAAAAEAEEQAQSLAAEITGDVETYVRLRLASAVLRAAIDRYREKNQGPVLARASRLFAELTVGSFSGLRADYNEGGDAVLVGIRARDGRTVTVDGMSDGTADQLYLALRLASLENYLDEHEPAPLIVDDILVNFDNQRSLATLRVLANVSRRTQVIFFTHHEHLVELAREHLDPDVLFVHRLGDFAALV
ncbi:MAG TPA: AAA family ATPase [Pirellulales bacterium]|nr:AAA family ATPase [Pirellulales bacterium]